MEGLYLLEKGLYSISNKVENLQEHISVLSFYKMKGFTNITF